jgi:hypothetical protein
MKWVTIGIPLFLLFIIFLLKPWGMVLSDFELLIVTVGFPVIGSVILMAIYRKRVLAIPILFYIIAFYFSYSFQRWAWNDETMFWYWVGAILGCVFAIGSIIFLVLKWNEIFLTFGKITALLLVFGIVYNLGIILWIVFVVYAGHVGM